MNHIETVAHILDQCRIKDVEIADLKSSLAAWKEKSDAWQEQSEERGKLITELADALDCYNLLEGHEVLVQRAREETDDPTGSV